MKKLLLLSLLCVSSFAEQNPNMLVFHLGYHHVAKALPLAYAFDLLNKEGLTFMIKGDDVVQWLIVSGVGIVCIGALYYCCKKDVEALDKLTEKP